MDIKRMLNSASSADLYNLLATTLAALKDRGDEPRSDGLVDSADAFSAICFEYGWVDNERDGTWKAAFYTLRSGDTAGEVHGPENAHSLELARREALQMMED